MAPPIICKYCEQLNIWLFKVKIKLKKVIITFADPITYLHFSFDSLTTFMPSLFEMFVYSEFMSNVTRRLYSVYFLLYRTFLRKSWVFGVWGYFLSYGLKVVIDITWNICSLAVHWAYYWATSVNFLMYFRL